MNVCVRNAGWGATAALAVAFGVALSGSHRVQGATQAATGASATQADAASPAAKRGEYLVMANGCWDCHTPHKMGPEGPEPDKSRWLSGHPSEMTVPPPPALSEPWVGAVAATMTAWSGPWGISYTANLTPDKETGLGEWTEEQFVQAIRSGRHQGRGRPILPPMPWPAYKNFTDEDLRAIFAYLRSIPPVKNKVPDPVMAPAATK